MRDFGIFLLLFTKIDLLHCEPFQYIDGIDLPFHTTSSLVWLYKYTLVFFCLHCFCYWAVMDLLLKDLILDY
jgi:hypothetical protein